MRFSDAFLRALRERVSIADYAGRRLAWDKRKSQPAKGDYWACCPFHHEKSPSFHVLDAKGVYKCFGCGESGDVFTLSMKLEGGSFPETVERIANFYGVPLPADEREDQETSDRRKRLHEAMARAAQLYAEALAGSEGREARAYLAGRGLDAQICARFGIGYAPGGWTWLIDRLKGQFPLDELIEAGLAREGNEGRRAIDFFRERITFEIADGSGRVIGFGGRTLDPNQPAKYINSPETPLFHKGRVLYRLKQARETAAKTKAAGLVVAEGYLDVIAFERAEIGAVAPLGTALTDDQLQLVWRAGGEPVLCFDGDDAGHRAADRSLDLALPHLGPGRTVRIAVLSKGEDPFDVYRRGGGPALRDMLDAAQPAAAYLFARELARRPIETPEAKADLKKRLRDAAARVGDEDTRRLYIRDLMDRADAAIGLTRRPAAGAAQAWRPGPAHAGPRRGGPSRFAPPAAPSPELRALSHARADAQLERLLRMAVDHPGLLDRGADALAQLSTGDHDLECIKSGLLGLWFRTQSVDRVTLSLHLRDLGEARAAARLDAWPRPKTSAEELEGDWLELVAPESAKATFAKQGETLARVAKRAELKAKAQRPKPISPKIEAEWDAQLGVGLAASAIREEARALHDRVDDDPEAMARAQELLKDRLRAAGDALRISQDYDGPSGNGAEDSPKDEA